MPYINACSYLRLFGKENNAGARALNVRPERANVWLLALPLILLLSLIVISIEVVFADRARFAAALRHLNEARNLSAALSLPSPFAVILETNPSGSLPRRISGYVA